jgi:hypothetical protein
MGKTKCAHQSKLEDGHGLTAFAHPTVTYLPREARIDCRRHIAG